VGDPLLDAAERLAAVFAGAGFPRMAARALMSLFVAPEGALTAGELRERLGVSAAAVSGAVGYLERIGMVRRLPQTGSRKELYELPDHAWYTTSLRSTPVYDAIADLLPDGIAAARASGAEAAAARLTEMREFFEFLRARLPELLAEWQAERDGHQG
jgi:DNA-binding transcriptional regulator GbsR (MarR family)